MRLARGCRALWSVSGAQTTAATSTAIAEDSKRHEDRVPAEVRVESPPAAGESPVKTVVTITV